MKTKNEDEILNLVKQKYKNASKKHDIVTGIGTICFIVFIVCSFKNFFIIALIALLVGFATLRFSDSITSEFIEFYKKSYIKLAINNLGFSYESLGGMDKSVFDSFKIYKKSNIKSEDYIQGVYKGVKFGLCDVISSSNKFVNSIDNSGTRLTIFSFIIDIANLYDYFNFTGLVMICEHKNSIKSEIFVIDKALNTKRVKNLVKFNDIAFSDVFKVSSLDGNETKEFLNSNLRSKLVSIHNKNYSSAFGDISFIFGSNLTFIFIKKSENIFHKLDDLDSVSLKDLSITKDGFKEYQDEILGILRILDELGYTK